MMVHVSLPRTKPMLRKSLQGGRIWRKLKKHLQHVLMTILLAMLLWYAYILIHEHDADWGRFRVATVWVAILVQCTGSDGLFTPQGRFLKKLTIGERMAWLWGCPTLVLFESLGIHTRAYPPNSSCVAVVAEMSWHHPKRVAAIYATCCHLS